jgi:ESF2/ABP1 family protein
MPHEQLLASSSSASSNDDQTGVIYLSRIPPTMTPHEIRSYLAPFGKIGRIYLAPDEKTSREKKHVAHDPRDRRKARFTEGWVEFVRKKDAKTAALALNGSPIGGSRKSNRFHDDLWSMKYLKGFKWKNLHEEEQYERAVRQQKLRTEIAQGRKLVAHYTKQVERAHEQRKIEEKRALKAGRAINVEKHEADQLAALKSRFRQRKPIVHAEQQ